MDGRGILITGAAGFIGSAFVRSALARRPGAPVVALDALTYAGSRANLPDDERLVFAEGDIRDGALVRKLIDAHDVGLVVHLAAESHVDRSIDDPAEFVSTNVLGTQAVLDACRAAWGGGEAARAAGCRFHHVSTDEVYGDLGPDDPAFTEATPYAPSSPYSASKAGSDHLVRAAARTHGLPVTITNCSNNYGPRQYPEKLIPVVIGRAAAGEPIPVYGDGQNVRDWLYVGDHCEAIWAVVERGTLGETYNVGGDAEVANLDLVRTLCAILDSRRPDGAPHADLIEMVADRPGHDRRYAVEAAKTKALGWAPRQSLRSGLESTVDWYLDNHAWAATVLHENATT